MVMENYITGHNCQITFSLRAGLLELVGKLDKFRQRVNNCLKARFTIDINTRRSLKPKEKGAQS